MHHQLRPKETTLLLHSVTSLSGSNFLITVFLLLGSFYFYEGDFTETTAWSSQTSILQSPSGRHQSVYIIPCFHKKKDRRIRNPHRSSKCISTVITLYLSIMPPSAPAVAKIVVHDLVTRLTLASEHIKNWNESGTGSADATQFQSHTGTHNTTIHVETTSRFISLVHEV